MKNLRKLSKSNLKTIKGGNAPLCDSGYMACRVGKTPSGAPIWECLPNAIINNKKGTSVHEVPFIFYILFILKLPV